MIAHEYRCEDCKHVFSLNRRISDRERQQVTCPKCKSKKVSRQTSKAQAKSGK